MSKETVLCVRISFTDFPDRVMHLNPRDGGMNYDINFNEVTVTNIRVCFHDAADDHGLQRLAEWHTQGRVGKDCQADYRAE